MIIYKIYNYLPVDKRCSPSDRSRPDKARRTSGQDISISYSAKKYYITIIYQ